jgi:protein-tyrosine phosphatase
VTAALNTARARRSSAPTSAGNTAASPPALRSTEGASISSHEDSAGGGRGQRARAPRALGNDGARGYIKTTRNKSMALQASLSDTRSAPSLDQPRSAPALAVRYAAYGLASLSLAPFAHQFAWAPIWLGVSNLVLSRAYAQNRPAVFGKRRDGTLAPTRVALLLPYLLLVWGFFAIKRLGLRREPCFHEVAPGLYLGRRPDAGELPADCRLVVDLTCEFVEPQRVVGAYAYRCLPTLNRHVPSDAAARALVDDLLACGEPIYVHCGAGRGRSAMVVAALLVLTGRARDAEDAERTLRRIRRGVRLHAAQKALIQRICGGLPRDAAPGSRPPSSTPKCA